MTGNRCGIAFGEDENVLKWSIVSVAKLCEYAKNH